MLVIQLIRSYFGASSCTKLPKDFGLRNLHRLDCKCVTKNRASDHTSHECFLLAAKRTTSFPLNNGEGSGRNSINVPGTPGKYLILFPLNLNSGEDFLKYKDNTQKGWYVLNTNYLPKERNLWLFSDF